jgi:hypothetical protein
MPAKGPVPVVAFPCIDRFRSHGPLQGRWMLHLSAE